MAELYYSLTSKKKLFHLASCSCRSYEGASSGAHFFDAAEARNAGYYPCGCCLRIMQQYWIQQEAIQRFCRKSGLVAELRENTVHIVSVSGCWRITAESYGEKTVLYHRSTQFRLHPEPSAIAGFHRQPVVCDSILSYLEYIASHDRFKNMPYLTKPHSVTLTKKEKKLQKRCKRKEKKANAFYVYNLIDELRAMNSL